MLFGMVLRCMQGVLSFIRYRKIAWPNDAMQLLTVSVFDVQDWRKYLGEKDSAPKTINSYTSSLSSFFRFMQAVAAEQRLPLVIPNPAHAQFIKRDSNDPVKDTESLSISQVRQLLSMPEGNDVIALRDRAILTFYYLSGSRIATGCSLNVSEFNDQGEVATYRAKLKGGRIKTKGLHVVAAQAIREYLNAAEIGHGPLFRSNVRGRARKLSDRRCNTSTMYRLLMSYLQRLPGAMVEEEVHGDNGEKRVVTRCRYHPHVLRASFATLNPASLEDIQEQLDHRNITTTRGYRKKKLSVALSASHEAPL